MKNAMEQSPGYAAPPPARDLKSIREERRLVRAQLELGQLHREKKLAESLTVYDGISGLADLFQRFHDVNGDWYPLVGSRQDKVRGQNFPFYRTEMELNLLRQPSRLLYGTNMYAQGIVNGLQSYVVGEGFTYQAEELFDSSSNDGEVAAVQRVIDDFCEANMMQEFEEEAVMRGERDGEGLARIFWPDDYETAELRVVEPELILKPPGTADEEWSFGIRNPVNPVDTQKAIGYWVAPMEVRENGEYVEANEMMHFKRNCERTVKRGCPSFTFSTYESLDGANRLKRNVTEGAAVQAAIAEIVQYENATKSEIQSLMTEKTDYTRANPLSPTTSSRDINYQKVQPGTRRNIPKGMTYVTPPGAMSVPGHVEALQASLRAAGIRWNAPEWLSSGLHDTSSFASSLTAESPFVKGIKRMQGFYGRRFVMLLKLVIQMAEAMGRLRPGVLKRVKIKAKGPSIEIRDRLKEAQADQVCLQMQTKSPQQICQEQGNDYEETALQIEEHTERFGPPGGALGMPGDVPPGEGGSGQRPAPFKSAQEGRKTVRESLDPAPILLDVPDLRQTASYDCGAAALRAAAAYFGVGGSEADYIDLLGTNAKDGTDSDAIMRLAIALGLHIDCNQNDIAIPYMVKAMSAGVLFICPIQAGEPTGSNAGHYVVVCGYNPSSNTLTLQDPVSGRAEISCEDFVQRWHDKGGDGREFNRFGVGVWK